MLFLNIRRCFSTSINLHRKVVPSNVKGSSSSHWLSRQLNDPYVEKAKMFNYRSAFKLLEMDDRYKFLRPGQGVVDFGAAPGSWTQVAVRRVNADRTDSSELIGKVIAVDKQQIYPIDGAIVLGNLDVTAAETPEKVIKAMDLHSVDVVLSDMAPAASGVKHLDKESMIHLCYMALQFAVKVSAVGATLVVKLWQCEQSKTLESDMSRFYKCVKVVKPSASRGDSAEIFLLARNFKGLKGR